MSGRGSGPAPRTATLIAALALALVICAGAAGAAAQENNASPRLGSPVEDSQARTSLADIEDEVMCPICGTSLQLSQSPQADRERAFIQELVAGGATKDEVKDALVAEYGPEVLALPEGKGFDLAAWLVPAGAIVAAGVGIGLGLRRWRRGAGLAEEGEPKGLDASDDERLDADIARYDL